MLIAKGDAVPGLTDLIGDAMFDRSQRCHHGDASAYPSWWLHQGVDTSPFEIPSSTLWVTLQLDPHNLGGGYGQYQ